MGARRIGEFDGGELGGKAGRDERQVGAVGMRSAPELESGRGSSGEEGAHFIQIPALEEFNMSS